MRRLIVLIALILGVALAGVAPGAHAALSDSCIKLRQSIVDLERKVPSGAALSVDLAVRRIYVRDCIMNPSGGATGGAPDDPWFNAAGDPASGPPPNGDGVFQTTPEAAAGCKQYFDPVLCVLLVNLGEVGYRCPGGQGYCGTDHDLTDANELPPISISVDGQQFSIDAQCAPAFGKLFLANGALGKLPPGEIKACPVLRSIQPHIAQIQRGAKGWLAPATQNPFVTPNPAAAQAQNGFSTLCDEAWTNESVCRQSEANMASVGSQPAGTITATNSQVGAFDDCVRVYDGVVQMCRQSGWQQPAGSTASGVAIPDHCQANATAYANAAQAQNTQAAIQAYQALSSQPACANLLAQVAAASGMPLPQRPMGSLTKSVFGCMDDRDPSSCSSGPSSGYASDGASGGGGDGFDIGGLMNLGMALGGMAGQMNAMRGLTAIRGGSNMNSLAMPPVKATYGNGGPVFTRPPTPNQSTITGLGN